MYACICEYMKYMKYFQIEVHFAVHILNGSGMHFS